MIQNNLSINNAEYSIFFFFVKGLSWNFFGFLGFAS